MKELFPDSSLLGIRKMINGHKSAAHTDSPDGVTERTRLGGGMHCPSAFSLSSELKNCTEVLTNCDFNSNCTL